MSHHRRHDHPSPTPAAPAPAATAAVPFDWARALRVGNPKPDAGGSPVLGFLLQLVPAQDGRQATRLEGAPVLLKAQAHGAPTAFALDGEHLAASNLRVAERRLAATVLGQTVHVHKGRSYAALTGQLGDALLVEMLDTAPCFLGGVAGLRLARGRPHALTWQWLRRDNGNQDLSPVLHAHQQLLRVGALWYLDAQEAVLGQLSSTRTEAWLLDLPTLTPDAVPTCIAALTRSSLRKRIPLPHRFAPVRTLTAAPIPQLTLHTASIGSNGERTLLAFARLGFDYDGQTLPAHGPACVRCVRGGDIVEIQRNRSAELAVVEQLERCGLHPGADTDGLPWQVAERLPDDAWLFAGSGPRGALEVNAPVHWLAACQRLQQAGFGLAYADTFPFTLLDPPTQWYLRAREIDHGRRFELEIGVQIGHERINLLPAASQALHNGELKWPAPSAMSLAALWYAAPDPRRRLPVVVADLTRVLAPLADHLERPLRHLRLPRVQAGRIQELAELLPPDSEIDAPETLRGFTARLLAHAQTPEPLPARLCRAQLRPYQREGLRWLNALAQAGLGGVLADDMGLGKTVQVLAHLATLKQNGALEHPALIVVPTSLIPNWESEIRQFTPALARLTLSGPDRATSFADIESAAIVLTSYALLARDLDALREHSFSVLILDESQQVKNPHTQARHAAAAIPAPRRVCLSGTPLENHLGELWSEIDLAVPGLLGNEATFKRHYRVPIEKEHDDARQARLNRRVAPFMLRRTKNQVARELPPKTEVVRRVIMNTDQRRLYEGLRERFAQQLVGPARNHVRNDGIAVLQALLELRQVCCDPRLLKHGDGGEVVPASGKFELLLELVPALLAEGRHVLVFSQFTEMLGLIADALRQLGLDFVMLTGDTRDRAEPVRQFQAGEVPLFLLSLRTGGVGLNLTAADAVIHYDPWWNPAVEAQASDRAHRIGQDKPVLIYRLITADTVEERIEAMQVRKAELSEAVMTGGTRERLSFDASDIATLLAPA